MPRIDQRQRVHCSLCGEPTTHVFKKVGDAEPDWVCLCCESAKFRSASELEKIKKTRKGWKETL
jgi:peptide methionine sulfoxide reductase MsrB